MTRNQGKILWTWQSARVFQKDPTHSITTLSWNIIIKTWLIWTSPVPGGRFINYLLCRTIAWQLLKPLRGHLHNEQIVLFTQVSIWLPLPSLQVTAQQSWGCCLPWDPTLKLGWRVGVGVGEGLHRSQGSLGWIETLIGPEFMQWK